MTDAAAVAPGEGDKGRTLAAWFPVEDEQRPSDGPGSVAWAQQAASVLAARPPHPDQTGLIQVLPPELAGYADAVLQNTAAQRMLEDGWALAMVSDLRRLIAAQQTVSAVNLDGGDPIPGDLLGVAGMTLPLEQPSAEIPAAFDAERQIWKITSKNPNVRITGRFGGEVRPGALGFGFIVEVLTSFVSVAEYNGLLVLRDGYHRTQRLLRAGIFTAPVFVRRFGGGEKLFARQMVPPEVWGGERPPLLADYGDDRLAHDTWLPPTDTTLYVTAVPATLAISRSL